MGTLRGRLSRILTLMLVAVFLVQWVILSFAIRQVSEEQMLMHLEHDSGAILATLDVRGDRPQLDVRGLEPVYLKRESGHYYVVHVDDAHVLASESLGSFAMATPHGEDQAQWDYRAAGPAKQPLIVLARSEMLDGHRVRLYVAEDLSQTNAEILQLTLASVLVFVPLLAAALVLQGLGIKRALQPLVQVGEQLRDVGAGKHAHIEGDVPQEIKPLVAELNRLLALLQRRLDQSRTALGNLAHALKTPLAVLFRGAEDARMSPELQELVRGQADSIRERLERELRRARLAGSSGSGAGALFNAASEVPTLLRVLGRVHGDKAIDFDVTAPDEQVPFDREDMLELLGNLADNACKWAAARVAIRVEVCHDAQPAFLRIEVADDGPGCAGEDMQEILKRGVRLDEAISGHGLGLAITHDIVEFYGGRMSLDRDPRLGGLRVAIELPRPPALSAAGG